MQPLPEGSAFSLFSQQFHDVCSDSTVYNEVGSPVLSWLSSVELGTELRLSDPRAQASAYIGLSGLGVRSGWDMVSQTQSSGLLTRLLVLSLQSPKAFTLPGHSSKETQPEWPAS